VHRSIPPRATATALIAAGIVAAMIALAIAAAPAAAQQVPDSTYDTRVAHPAFTQRHPRVLFDEAHHNFHTSTGRYKVFADLITHDGCVVTANKDSFTTASLAGHDILVISNALGADRMLDTLASHPAFTERECDAVGDWVRAGGSLLLIADHAPMGSAARPLAARFGVDMRNGVTADTVAAHYAEGNPTLLVYSRANGLLGNHAITRGRDSTERIGKVLAFTGQSLKGPEGSFAFLILAPSSLDLIAPSLQAAMSMSPDQGVSAAGRAQGLAFAFGKGRVVVMGEAGMLSAQLAGPPGPGQRLMGMNYPGLDNRQLALNIVRWLARLLN
jgi:hypothetical protein